MKSIEFAERYVEPIQAGAKTATVRIDECEEIEKGDHLQFETPSGEVFWTARISSFAVASVEIAPHVMRVFEAEHAHDRVSSLLETLEEHYDREIRRETECRVLCWDHENAGEIDA
ncbi:ASCH domain-containing protein [Salinarchaeum laminariae]|uniref:ASCH domain-containing protein n=1 Tax=Salinarchaeum laminariae TaxID=869888 RepID=UPI0020C04CAF|nr:ASCH domain-containing protein [Salinarchaeum laminariae]